MKAPGAGPGASDLDAVYTYDAGGNVGQLVAWATGFGGAEADEWHVDRLVARYEYDPYGRIVGPDTNSDGKFDGQDDPGFYAAANPFRWSTKRFDPETGSPQRISPQAELSDFGMRYYSATLGRWLNRDPIGDFATANLVRHSESRRRRTFSGLGGANVYAYVGNNPTNRTDYLGMMWIPCPPGEPCDDEGSSSSDPPSQEENDKKPCPKKPSHGEGRPPAPPLTPPPSPFGGPRTCSDLVCAIAFQDSLLRHAEDGGATAGITLCEGGKPCTCVFPAARMPNAVSNNTAQNILEECVQAHENLHVLQKDLSGECRGGGKPPPGDRECMAWTVHFTCLAKGASKCGRDTNCYAQLLSVMETLKESCKKQCKAPKFDGFDDCDSNYEDTVKAIEKKQKQAVMRSVW